METVVAVMDENNIDERLLTEAAEAIKKGGIVAFPTETVYGLGADAMNVDAVEKIFKAKGRPHDNPLIIHVADFDQVEKYVKNISDKAKKIMEAFWPGPITIIMEKKDIVPDETTAGLKTVGMRMPYNKIAREFIRKCNTTIAAPSANISGRPSITSLEGCIQDLNGKVDYILGGNNSEVGLESTIVDCTVSPICILRPGGITLEMLRTIDPDVYVDPMVMSKPKEDFKPKAPGMKYRHYAPKAPVKIISGDIEKTIAKINEMVLNYIERNLKVGVIATDETVDRYQGVIAVSLGSRNNPNEIGHNLFKVLRDFDSMDVDIILCEAQSQEGVGLAIMNRLNKSAGFDIVTV